jgi:hypothetical protein
MAAQRPAGGTDLATREAVGPRPGICQSSDAGDSEQSSRAKKESGDRETKVRKLLVERTSVATHDKRHSRLALENAGPKRKGQIRCLRNRLGRDDAYCT